MDGPPPAKKARNVSPDLNTDLSWNPLEINSELPDELGSINCQPVSTTSSSNISISKKVDDTIQRNHNLSQLLSSNNDLHGHGPTNSLTMHSRPMIAINQQQFRHQLHSNQLPQQHHHQPYSLSMAAMARPGLVPGSSHAFANNSANNIYSQNQLPGNYGPRQSAYASMRPMSNNTNYFQHNSRMTSLNGTVYPSHGVNGPSMVPGDGGFGGSQFAPNVSGIGDAMYCNQVPMGNKMAMQVVNGSLSGQQQQQLQRHGNDLKSSMTSSVSANCETMYSQSGNMTNATVAIKNAVAMPLTPKPGVMSPEAITGVCPVSPAISTTEALDPSSVKADKRREIQSQLVLLLHAHNCIRQDQSNGLSQACNASECIQMRAILKHMSQCVEGHACKTARCVLLRRIILHFKSCQNSSCLVCSPVKNKRNPTMLSMAAPPSTSAASVESTLSQPQSNASVLTSVDMYQACMTLGLDPRDHMNPVTPTTPQGSLGVSRQTSSSVGVSGNHKAMVAGSSALLTEQSNQLSLPSLDGVNVGDNASRPRKPWHLDMTDNHREHLVQKFAADLAFVGRGFFEECTQQDRTNHQLRHQYDQTMTVSPTAGHQWSISPTAGHQRYLGNDSKVPSLVQAIFPSAPDLNVVRQDQMNSLIRYARKVEGDMYDNADSKEDYYHLLAQKIYKIQKELEEKRMKRLMDNGGGAQASSVPATPLQGSIVLQSRLPQFSDNRLDLFMDGNSSNNSSMVRSQTPQFLNTRFPQEMYGVRMMRPQSASGATMFQDVHPSTGQACHSAISVDGFPNQRPNFPNSKHDLPFGGQEVIGPPSLHDQLPPSSNLLVATQPSQSSLLQQQQQQQQQMQQQQMQQQQPFANSTQATICAQQQHQQTESQSPYHRVSGPSPRSNPLAPSGMQSSTTSPSVFGINGDRTPGPASCNPPQLTSPVGNFKMAVKHEDITDDEVTVKSEPRSPEDFKYVAPQPVHEDITDDEAEAAAATTAAAAAVEVKMEEVKKEEAEEEAVAVTMDTKTEAVLDSGSEVRVEGKDVVVTGDEEAVTMEEKVEMEEGKVPKDEPDSPVEEGPRGRKVWKPEELQTALFPIFEKLFCLDEAIPFREPVDAVALGIFDYHDIIKYPMDLSTIRSKLEAGSYTHPWQFIDDINLMFDNAWLYNRKTSKVYKFCSKLAEVFEAAIDPIMQSLGFCCGRRYVFSPQVLCCFGKQLCTIPRDTIYYNYQDRYIYCEKCFNDLRGDDVEMADDPSQPGLKIKKDQFVKEKNDKLDYEQFVECGDCHRKMHKICVLHMEQIWTEGFVCDACLKAKNVKRKENKHSARRLPTTKLATYLETRVNSLLKRKDSGSGDVTIRVLSCYDKAVEVKAGMKARYVASGEMPENIPYRVKAIFAFEEIDGVDVCFFGMHVQEYGSDCYATNARRVYIAYLDSVHYFQPRHFRTTVYHEILIGYMDYAKSLGYQTAHIWACPPSEGDDYIFHCHPLDQKIPKPKRLQEWYKKMLDKALTDRVISDYKDILRDAMENNFQDVTDMPYFEGDFWPNILEDCIKELEQEQLEKRRREEEEAAADTLVDFEPLVGDSIELQTLAGKKKGQKSGNIKKKNTKSKKPTNRKSKASLSHNGSDLSTKLLTTMDKHKEGFFVIRLQSSNEPTEIRDPDPLINCDLMDGRDAFLTLARDKHYEFSSLRRAKYASMGLLFELHNQAKDGFVYSCNDCRANVETRYHCSICDDFDLCIPCFKKSDHLHKGKMTKLGLDLDDSSSGADVKAQNPEEARRQSAQSYVQYLEHASQCRDANCRSTSCQKMKRNLNHVKTCQRGHTKGCPTCKGMLQLIYAHAKVCKETKCLVPFCPQVKQKFQQKRAQQQFKQQQLMRRRIALMQHGPEKESSAAQAQPTSDPPTPSVSGPHGGGGGCGFGGKYMFGMAPSPPTGALMAARQAEHTAQRQAGIGMPTGYPMQGMAMQQQQQHLQRSMMMTPNHMMDQQQQQQQQQAMYQGPGGGGGGGGGSGPMSMQEEMMYHSHQHGITSQGMHGPPHPMDQMCLQQQLQQQQQQQQLQQQLQPGQATSKQIAMLVAKVKAQSSPQQNPEVMTMLKQNPQLMASFIKQSHSQQSMSSGGGGGGGGQQHMMSSGMNTGNHMMDGMMDDPGGTMCSMPPGMIMSGMMPGQGSMVSDPSGQPRMSSQWLQQQHQMRALHPDYGGQQFPPHMALGGGGASSGMYGGAGNMSQMHRMRMNFGAGGGPMHQQQQSAYIGDDMIPMYGGHSQQQQHQQEMQMQMMMQHRRLQARPTRMEVGGATGGAGQSVLPGGMVVSQRGATISHPAVDMQQQQPPSFPSSMPSNSALAAQPSTRTHAVLGKVAPSPRRPPPHYSDSVLMHQQGGASVTGGTMQRTSVMATAMPAGATDLNSYASAVAADQARLRFPAGTAPDFGSTTSGHSAVDGLQYSKNNPPRDSFSRFVNLPK